MVADAPDGIPPSLVALLAGAVDYAGLFPPASLTMRAALAAYRDAQDGVEAWMLGRFVVPASRLPELLECACAQPAKPLHLSVIVTDGAQAEVTAVAALRSSQPGALVADAIECKPRGLDSIDWLAHATGGACDVYVEVDPAADLDQWVSRLSAKRLRAKIRTGGIIANAFPSPGLVAAFMAAAVTAGVPFKATAGLHHAMRGPYRLTYEPGAEHTVMHGYLNVFLAAALLRAGHSRQDAERLLAETDVSSLIIEPASIRWRQFEWSAADLRALRVNSLIGFGSCSIAEPAEEIRALAAARHA
jgi:hypothetical protein